MSADFLSLQARFTAFIRNPDQATLPPGCDPERMRLYHQLFFNNFDGVLESTFERSRALMDADTWQQLVKDFFANEPQHSPFLVDVPGSFLDYLNRQTKVALTPALLELADYEAALHDCRMAEDLDIPLPEDQCNKNQGIDVLELAWQPHPQGILFESAYPVHQVEWDATQPPPVEPTWLWIQRDADGVVHTHQLSTASARWLQLLDEMAGQPAKASLNQLAQELHIEPAALTDFARTQLAEWRDAGLLFPCSCF